MTDLAIKYVGNPLGVFFSTIFKYLEIVGVIRTISELERLGHYQAARCLTIHLNELKEK